jgi:CTP:molybdopterin cytidylyltransferase MocA
MNAEQLDAALARWLHQQPDVASSQYHVQIKLWGSEVEMAQLTAAELTGWVIIDWQQRGLGLSAKRALDAAHAPHVAQALSAIPAPLMHIQVQVILAPAQDWREAYRQNSLTPDLLPVLDAGHASVLNLSAQRDHGRWHILQAHQPPNEQPIEDFGF